MSKRCDCWPKAGGALRGADVAGRFENVAQNWAPIADAGNYAFNDMHAMMCFVGAGREKEQQSVLDAQRAAMESDGDNAEFTREVGHPATLAIQGFGQARYAECVELLRPIRQIAHRFGGSHAQRDLLDQTLIEASRRAGFDALAMALLNERAALRPRTPQTSRRFPPFSLPPCLNAAGQRRRTQLVRPGSLPTTVVHLAYVVVKLASVA